MWIRHLRPDDVESIQLGFVLDARFVARPRTGIIGDGDIEMLADFVSGERGCDGASDQGRATQGSLGASDAGGDLLQVSLGGGQQFLTRAVTFDRQQRIAADDQTLARIFVAGDLREILLVVERYLNGALVTKLLDRRCTASPA